MLAVELAFNLLLRNDATVAALAVGGIYNDEAPQTLTYPYVVCRKEGRLHVDALDGPCGLRETRMRVYSVAKTYAEAIDLDEAIRMAIEGYQGTVADNISPSNTIYVQWIHCVFASDESAERNRATPGIKNHEIVADYEVTAHEEIPA